MNSVKRLDDNLKGATLISPIGETRRRSRADAENTAAAEDRPADTKDAAQEQAATRPLTVTLPPEIIRVIKGGETMLTQLADLKITSEQFERTLTAPAAPKPPQSLRRVRLPKKRR